MQICSSNYSWQEIHSLLCKVPPPHHQYIKLIFHNRIKDTIHANFTEFWLCKLHTCPCSYAMQIHASKLHPLTNKQLWLSVNDHFYRLKENISLPGTVVRRLSPFCKERGPPSANQRVSVASHDTAMLFSFFKWTEQHHNYTWNTISASVYLHNSNYIMSKSVQSSYVLFAWIVCSLYDMVFPISKVVPLDTSLVSNMLFLSIPHIFVEH